MRKTPARVWRSSALVALVAMALLAFAPPVVIPADEIHSHTTPYRSPDIVLRAEARLVEVPVVIRDGWRYPAQTFGKGDFRLFDAGKTQEISSFSVRRQRQNGRSATQASNAALSAGGARYIALCFDDLHLFGPRLQAIRKAAELFVKTNLASGDQVAVIPTSRSQKSTFTSDVPTLIAQIEKIMPAPPRAQPDRNECPEISTYEAYQIAKHLDPGDGVLLSKMAECKPCYGVACPMGQITARSEVIWERARSYAASTLGVIDGLVDGMAKLPGQRIVLLTSTGFLMGEEELVIDRLMDKARRADVVINSLDAKGLTADNDVMRDGAAALASGTGGESYRDNDLEFGFRQLGQTPETMYILGFTPSTPADGRFHKLKVQLAGKSRYDVEARLGYMSSKNVASADDSPAAKLGEEVKLSDTANGFPVSFQWQRWPGPPAITMVLKIDTSRLRFRPWKGRQIQKLTIIGTLTDQNGAMVAGKQSELELSFRDGTLLQLSKTGFTTALTIAAPRGHYHARAVAQEELDGKLSASSADVEIR